MKFRARIDALIYCDYQYVMNNLILLPLFCTLKLLHKHRGVRGEKRRKEILAVIANAKKTQTPYPHLTTLQFSVIFSHTGYYLL
jgi:hypothetical protein